MTTDLGMNRIGVAAAASPANHPFHPLISCYIRNNFYQLVPGEYANDITQQKAWVDEAIAKIETSR